MKATSASNLPTDTGLPDFRQPPVDEVALSFQFAPIAGFAVPHFGLYWQRIRKAFPRFEVQPPITNVTEQPQPRMRIQLGVSLMTKPELRCWFMDQSGNNLIQVQPDRFVVNWRKVTGAELYPRYPMLRDRLRSEWEDFCAFLKEEGLGTPQVNQCEVTYVNHIEYEKGWNGYGELGKVIEVLATPTSRGRFLPAPERVSMQVSYLLESDAGRLYVSFVPVIRARDGKEVLQMTLTARGAPESEREEDLFTWMDLGRTWVVKGFSDFTTETMHNVWGRQ